MQPPDPPLLSLRGVAKRYPNGTLALDHFDLDLAARDFVALLGPSGCGKSSALRLIAGLEAPSAGTLTWHDPAAAQQLGCVFQEPTLMPWARVVDNVFLPLRLRGQSREAAAPALAEVLRRVGLSRFADAYPRELSGGMRMRVSIARALLTRPRLLLLDEPFGALDEITRQQLGADLLAICAEQGFGVVFVTHSVDESVALAERILVMAPRPGRVLEQIEVDAPAPRAAAWRHSAGYAAQCRRVSQALQAALAGVGIDH